MLHEEVTGVAIGMFYKVYNDLGYGFLEKVYENALAMKLRQAGLTVQQQAPIHVHYEGAIIGQYEADILVNRCVILELKTAESIAPEYLAQLLNYLKATQVEVGLILNFGPAPQFKRLILTNDHKQSPSKKAK
jgi:GxxExxY protein